ncbi:HAD family hydrolase [Taibaiella chishuiensis]|uniref:Putative hydrolase of the HAD superfamily n=1 Tax=Taibaiella chishuiensis TaxID=1434707 RepID=A0A2P8D0D4_9BACT|nr:HAD family hydrolase [Taibaiella chishuiensis]PSK90683.1 putative hydrolase of the HAD superfamily [Taibaiella chishuiensis]
MELLRGLKHVSFDLWLTLIKSDPVFKPLRNQLFARYFDISRPAETVTQAFRYFDLLFNRINEKTGGNLQQTEMLYLILDHLGVSIETITAGDMQGYYHEMEQLFFRHHPQLIDKGTVTVLQAIKDQGCSVNILSNTGFILGSTLRQLLPVLGIGSYFDFQVYSDETGCSKPSADMYDQVWTRVKQYGTVVKEEVLHVGDNAIADYNGAQQFGFRSVLVDTQHNLLSNLFSN